MLFELLTNNPIQHGMMFIKGSIKTQFFTQDDSSFRYNPELPQNNMEGIKFSELEIENEYTGTMQPNYKGVFRIYNQTDKTKRIDYEIYQKLNKITRFEDGEPVGKWAQTILVQDTRSISLRPNGMEEVEFWYPTPPTPSEPQFMDVQAIRVLIEMQDEEGNKARLQDVALAQFGE